MEGQEGELLLFKLKHLQRRKGWIWTYKDEYERVRMNMNEWERMWTDDNEYEQLRMNMNGWGLRLNLNEWGWI